MLHVKTSPSVIFKWILCVPFNSSHKLSAPSPQSVIDIVMITTSPSPRHLYFQWKELWAVKGAQRWFSPRLTQCGSHIHFSGHVIQNAERGNIPAPRCQEARGDRGDGRLYYTEKHRRGGNRGREMCIMKRGCRSTDGQVYWTKSN